jgi:hypothetical protein
MLIIASFSGKRNRVFESPAAKKQIPGFARRKEFASPSMKLRYAQ